MINFFFVYFCKCFKIDFCVFIGLFFILYMSDVFDICVFVVCIVDYISYINYIKGCSLIFFVDCFFFIFCV